MKSEKPVLPPVAESKQKLINAFIGAAEGQSQRKQLVDLATNQVMCKFQITMYKNDRDDVKDVAGKISLTMNDFIVEAIREKIEKYQNNK